jgi:P2 family phage contractile tail tube protein
MRKGIASQLNRFECFDLDSASRIRGIVTVQLPALEVLTNAVKATGLGGEYNVAAPAVMAALTASISVPVIYGELISVMELGEVKTLDLRGDTIVNSWENHSLLKVPDRWTIKGIPTKSDPGKFENAASMDASFDIQISYIHHWLDGDDVLEWDLYNAIYTVNGKDLLAETRQNLMI